MGPNSLLTGRTLFLLSNGAIVPRRPTTPFPPHFVPFDWVPKPFVLRTPLPNSQPIDDTLSLFTPATNSVVQLPNTPHAQAIATVTGHIPSPLPADLLSSLHMPAPLTHNPPPPALHSPIHMPLPLPHPIIPTTLPPSPSILTTSQLPTPTNVLPIILQPTVPTHTPPAQTPTRPTPSPPIPPSPPPLRRSARISHPPAFWKGCYSTPSTDPPALATTTAAQRKLQNARIAAARNRQDRLNNPSNTPLNNRPTSLEPQLLTPQRAEMSIRKASMILPASDIAKGITKELEKHFNTYKSLTLIPRSKVESTQSSSGAKS